MFLDEYTCHLEEGRFLGTSLATIHCTLIRASLNIKRVQKLAAEHSPTIQANFVHWISHYPTEYLMCNDEVSKDDCTCAHLWERSHTGTCVEHHAPFICKCHFLMVAALALNEGIVAVKVVEGSFDRKMFMEYLCDDVVSLKWMELFLLHFLLL